MLNGTIKDRTKLRGRCSTLKFKFKDKIMTEARWPGVYCETFYTFTQRLKTHLCINVRHTFGYGRSLLSVLRADFGTFSESFRTGPTELYLSGRRSLTILVCDGANGAVTYFFICAFGSHVKLCVPVAARSSRSSWGLNRTLAPPMKAQ